MGHYLITDEAVLEQLATRLNKIELKLDQVLNEKSDSNEVRPLTRHDIARIFGVSLPTINDWCKREILKPFRVNSRVYFRRSDIDQLINSQRSK